METIIKAHPRDASQVKALKAFLLAMDIRFELEPPYNPAFVEMVRQGEEDLKAGKGVKMTLAELNALWK